MQNFRALKQSMAALALAATASLVTAKPIINLIDIGGVTGSQAEQGFRIAAKYWESVLTNNAVINFEVGYAGLGPNVLGSTGSTLLTYVPIGTYYTLLNSNKSSALDTLALDNLSPLSGTGSVEVKVPEYFDTTQKTGVAASGTRNAPDNEKISQTIALSLANVKALIGGYENVVDAQIKFSSNFAFDFDPSDGITPGMYDFIGVAVHEMGHALGFISGADDFNYSVGPYDFKTDDYWWGYGMDMFRYSGGGVLDWTFGTNSYFSIDGGDTAYLDGYLSTGEDYGDGWQASHWKSPGNCSNFLGIMNPYICNELTEEVTALDLALFDAIGWNTSVDVSNVPDYRFTTAQMYAAFAVPEPGGLGLAFAGLGLVAALRRRRAEVLVN